MWRDLAPVGRSASSGGYFRQPFASAGAGAGGLVRVAGRWLGAWCWSRTASGTWWRGGAARGPGAVVTGSHLDSVLDGGAYDGPLGVVSALAALDLLVSRGFSPARPLGVSVFVEEEGSRFGLACLGSRLASGAVSWETARVLRDRSGVSFEDALASCVAARTGWRVAARGRRDVRGAARRAGPGPGRPAVRADRRRERDLAARAVPLRVRRLRRPRRHDADGGPRRPDADLRDDRAGGQQAGPAGRRAGDVRAPRGDAELDELRALGA